MESSAYPTLPQPSLPEEWHDAYRCVERIDFSLVRHKLAHPDDGTAPLEGDGLADAIRQYRLFLVAHALDSTAANVPTKLIDRVWHTHILDTRAYSRDCQLLFGHFMHHDPSLGVGGEADAARLAAQFMQTAARWERLFGEAYGVASSRCEKHACHVPSSCRCRVPGACSSDGA